MCKRGKKEKKLVNIPILLRGDRECGLARKNLNVSQRTRGGENFRTGTSAIVLSWVPYSSIKKNSNQTVPTLAN
jgi:hypothetical protein